MVLCNRFYASQIILHYFISQKILLIYIQKILFEQNFFPFLSLSDLIFIWKLVSGYFFHHLRIHKTFITACLVNIGYKLLFYVSPSSKPTCISFHLPRFSIPFHPDFVAILFQFPNYHFAVPDHPKDQQGTSTILPPHLKTFPQSFVLFIIYFIVYIIHLFCNLPYKLWFYVITFMPLKYYLNNIFSFLISFRSDFYLKNFYLIFFLSSQNI